MFENLDIVELWKGFISFMNRVMAWLVFVVGRGDWNPDYFER